LKVQLAFELLVAIAVRDDVRRADLNDDERVAAGTLAQFAERDAIRSGRDHFHVLDDLVPPRQLVVGSDREPDKLFRRRHGARGAEKNRQSAERQQDQRGGDEARTRRNSATGH
jgi:hypothetical protein